MSRSTGLVPTALVAVLSILAAACSGSSVKAHKSPTTTTTTTIPAFSITPTRVLTLSPLAVAAGGRGSTAAAVRATVGIRPSSDHELRVVVREHNVGTTGAQWQAAGWNAVVVATLITGAPLSNREVDFDVSGSLNGLGAGALLTIAVVALIRGDSLASDITMVGAINPDGTISPAGGVAYKSADLVAAHKRRVLLPEGEAESLGASGALKGVVVSEVADVYDAYRRFTGVTLPQLPASTNPRLDSAAYDKLQTKVSAWSAKYQSSLHDFQGLAPELRQDLQSYAFVAAQDQQKAQKLAGAGSQAGAFQAAVSAAALMNAIAQTGQSLQVLLSQGPAPFVSRIKASQSIGGRVTELVKTLGASTPKSVSDVGALVSAYSNAIDALSLATFANGLFDTHASNRQVAINDAAEGAIYYNVAGTLVDAAADIFGVGQGLGGPAIGPKLDVADVATFFRQAAEANVSAFQSMIVRPYAAVAKTSAGAADKVFAGADLDYALAEAGDQIVSSLPALFGRGPGADYAELGGALALYDRSAGLLADYSSLGQVDSKTLQLTGIGNDTAFNAVIRTAQSQLAANVGRLQSRGVSSVTAVSDNEIAGVDQNGSAADQFGALGDYWDGYLDSRMLAYLGGFPAP